MTKHQQDNKMSGKIAIYQIMMAKHQQMTIKHQERWQNITWYHKVSNKMTRHQHGNTNSDKMMKHQHDSKISDKVIKHPNMDDKTSHLTMIWKIKAG